MKKNNLEAELNAFDSQTARLNTLVADYDFEKHLVNLRKLGLPDEKLEKAEEIAEFIRGNVRISMDLRQLRAIQESPSTKISSYSQLEESLELLRREYSGLKRYDFKVKSRMERALDYGRKLLGIPKGIKMIGSREPNEWFAETATIMNVYRNQLGTIMKVVNSALKKVGDELCKGNMYKQRTSSTE